MDQRKVNVLAREYAGAKKKKFKPVIISHHMLAGLKEGQEKMSKSDPDSAIFMEGTVTQNSCYLYRFFEDFMTVFTHGSLIVRYC